MINNFSSTGIIVWCIPAGNNFNPQVNIYPMPKSGPALNLAYLHMPIALGYVFLYRNNKHW